MKRSNLKNDCLAFVRYVSNASDTEEGKMAYRILKKHNLDFNLKDANKLLQKYKS